MKKKILSVCCLIGMLICVTVAANFSKEEQVAATFAMQSEEDIDKQLQDEIRNEIPKEAVLEESESFADSPESSLSEELSADDVESESNRDCEDDEDSEYQNLAIADVHNYVNVRSEPNTDSEILGKMYDGSVAQILEVTGEEGEEWFKVVSGSVEGYIKAEYFISGEDALEVIEEYIIRYARIVADRLNVRQEPDINSKKIGYIDFDEKVKLIEYGEEWSKVQYTEDKTGFVSTQYIVVEEEFIYAKSIEEEQAELAALAALAAREQSANENISDVPVLQVSPPATDYASVSELRMAIVEYAMQYLGNRYIMGGKSLAGGTDCSGFTCYIFREFGINLSRVPTGQWGSNGRLIFAEEVQPGDIVCYSSKANTCTHVGIYIGDGKIIHSANSRDGVIISNMYYDNTFIGIKNVID